MTQVEALERHDCPACGASAEWNPTRQKLVCPFCGTASPYAIDREQGTVVEQDLVTALRELPDEARGWQAVRRSVQCQSCRAVMVFEAARVGQNCEFCGSPALVDCVGGDRITGVASTCARRPFMAPIVRSSRLTGYGGPAGRAEPAPLGTSLHRARRKTGSGD
jgi:hypothetical protein